MNQFQSSYCVTYPANSSPFIVIEDDVRERLIDSLGSWHFQPLKLPEEEVLACAYILFESLFRLEGMQEDAGISLRASAGVTDPILPIHLSY